MGKNEPSDSEVESEKLSESEEEEEEEEPVNPSKNVAKQGISHYEKQRLSRIAENKARMEALGLHKMATSFMGSAQKSIQSRKTNHRKGKGKVIDDDDDYRPNDDDDVADDQDEDVDDFEEDENDEDFLECKTSSKSRRNKVKNKGSKPKKKIPCQPHFDSADNIGEVDDELTQAIALSLQNSVEDATLKERKGNANMQEDPGKRKRKKSFNDRVKMTEDEVVLHFFQLDAAGNGCLTVRDLRNIATAHDFTWTDKELAAMIHCFDSDGDAKLNLDDFRKIVSRCNMIRGSENH
ncbi:hypothetical protein JCGZ_14567 [Jatropha curcas]|uniref:EF-hand domain-containing protein n=1 Tax=Jatropha curcas TaxID=180498 RepID=A0A067JXW4_JATCU|nr:DNA ligase 1 [Jatropha curcas]KDP28796.1 hypothetical protein JCGZ_14567 [Jatropha curcas]